MLPRCMLSRSTYSDEGVGLISGLVVEVCLEVDPDMEGIASAMDRGS